LAGLLDHFYNIGRSDRFTSSAQAETSETEAEQRERAGFGRGARRAATIEAAGCVGAALPAPVVPKSQRMRRWGSGTTSA